MPTKESQNNLESSTSKEIPRELQGLSYEELLAVKELTMFVTNKYAPKDPEWPNAVAAAKKMSNNYGTF